MDIKTAKEVSKVFVAVHTSATARLARGAKERKRIFETLKKGEPCQSYRLNWLKTASDELVHELACIAQRFNEGFQFDQCSVADLLDVLEMASEKLRKG